MVIQQSRPPAKTWLLAGLELIAALLAAGLIAWTQRPCTCPHHHVKPAAPQIHWGWVEYGSLVVAVAALGWWLVRREASAAIVSAAALAGLASSPAVRGLAAQSHLIAMVALELLMVACPLLLLRTRPRPSVARAARSSGWMVFAVAAAVLYGGLLIVIHLPAVHRHGAAAPLWLAPAALAIGVAYWFGVLCTADNMTTRARRVLLLGAQEVAAFIGLLSLFGATWDQRLGGLFMMATCTAVTRPLVRRLQPCDSGPNDQERRRDRGRTGRTGRGALAAVAGIRADDFRAGADAGRAMDGDPRPHRRVAGHARQQQPHHDGLQRP
jgi:hypothetical protein